MTTAALLAERFARQGLAARSATSVSAATSLPTAVQAQDNQASRLGVRARTPSSTEADVVAAIEVERTITRTWLLRGSIHLVDTRDLRWLVRLIGPPVERRYRTRWRHLGLGDDLLDASHDALPEILAAGPLTRHEIATALAERGVSFSPATAADFTTWSGIGAARAIALIRDELTPCDVDGRPGFRLGSVAAAGGVRLLPAFDNYLLVYRHRTAMLRRHRHPLVYRGGIISPTRIVDGLIAGTWALDRAKRPALITLTPFDPVP